MVAEPTFTVSEFLAQEQDYCFIAMDFGRGFDAVYDEIFQPAINDSGLRSIRSDELLSASGLVIDEIVQLIEGARFVVVDITSLNPNVLIELGAAHALKSDIVILTQDTRKIPFDISSRRILQYDLSENGKKLARNQIRSIVGKTVFPSDSLLRSMLHHGPAERLVLLGSPSQDHLRTVYPPIDANYDRALRRSSSEGSGIRDIALAQYRVALGLGEPEPPKLDVTLAQEADENALAQGSVFVLGGQGANKFSSILFEYLKANFVDPPEISATYLENRQTRYRIVRGGTEIPQDQDTLLAASIDVGMLLRFPNPFCGGALIWLAAGVRKFGTEAAIRVMTTPSLIKAVSRNVDISDASKCIGAVFTVQFDDETGATGDINIVQAFEVSEAGLA